MPPLSCKNETAIVIELQYNQLIRKSLDSQPGFINARSKRCFEHSTESQISMYLLFSVKMLIITFYTKQLLIISGVVPWCAERSNHTELDSQ